MSDLLWLILGIALYVVTPITGAIMLIDYLIIPIGEHYANDCHLLAKNLTKINDTKEFTIQHDKYYPKCILAF